MLSQPKPVVRWPFVLGGLGAVVVGLVALGYGLAPVGDLVDAVGPAFSGGAPPEDLGERIDASIKALTARAVWDGVGFVGVLAGFILMKSARRVPKPRPIEDLVQAAVSERLATMGLSQAARAAPALPVASLAAPSVPPAPAPVAPPVPVAGGQMAAPRQVPVAAPPPAWPASTAPKVCPDCGGRLVAGGRVCSSCRKTFA